MPTTSSSQYLARLLGHEDVLRQAEDAYAAGTMDNFAVSVLDAEAWRGRTVDEVNSWLDSLPLIDGIAEVVAWCERNDALPALATLAWEPVGSFLCERFGFVAACGPRLAMSDRRYRGAVAAHLDEFGKRDFAATFAADAGVSLERCVAVGDSRSDLPLFSSVGCSIAFNASEALKDAATVVIDSPDLQDIIPSLEQAVSRAP